MKQCAVLFVSPDGKESAHPERLRQMGFVVFETPDWPEADGAVREYHVITVHLSAVGGAPMLAARLRAKPHFGRRVLIALVHHSTPLPDRRAAEASGFDEVVNDCCDSRQLAARILRNLRARPELRCTLPSPARRNRAA